MHSDRSDKETKSSAKPNVYKKFCDDLAPGTIDWRKGTVTPLNPKKLIEDAETYLARASVYPSPTTSRTTDIYNDNLIVAEDTHADMLSKKFLLECMNDLKATGFEILFFEHLFYNDQQLLDDYFSTGVMDDKLEKRLDELDDGHGFKHRVGPAFLLWKEYNFSAVVRAAYEAGIRIVGLDIESSYRGIKRGDERTSVMNYLAAQVIKREMDIHKCKWLSLMGCTHSSKIKKEGVPGVADLTGARTLLISDSKAPLSVKFNYSNTFMPEPDFRDPLKVPDEMTLSGDIFISGSVEQPITQFSLSDARKSKLEDIQSILLPKSQDSTKKEEKINFRFGFAVMELTREAILKQTVTEKDYINTIQQIHLLLTNKIEPKEGIFASASNPTKTELEAFQKVIDLITPDLPLQSDEARQQSSPKQSIL